MIHSNITLILTLSLLIIGSPFVAKILRLPIPPVEIILGSIFTYLGFIGHNEYFYLVAEVGFLYLMFLAGMEVDLKQITNSPKEIIRKSLLFLFFIVFFSIVSGLIFNLNTIIIISMPLISIGLLAALSKTYGKTQPWIRLALIAGVLGEIASIAALTILDAAVVSAGGSFELILKIGYLLLFIVVIYVLYRAILLLFWWFPEFKKVLMPKLDTSDQKIRLSIALFFIMIAIMLSLELELALGAFIAGVAISAFFHHEKELEEKMSSLGFGFLVPLFFIHVGSSFDLRALPLEGVVSGALLITFLMLLSRVLAAIVLKNISGSRDALLIALSLSMPLTLLVAVATIGYETKLLDLLNYYQLILASIFEILLSMTIIKILHKTR
ncbi:MAG: NA+/H+ antiporter (napA), putative [uncultured Sulfurovum sp.]|uniref:NA+/H+ antiporter (NapA), putative n=1 Tax=uncultured Sulfurovum sp. TaxID=269237 RepID=A0A6S6T0M8_9BACT|nr:MAG: NA+/H+ antiporter (napA), putative [uncultured Sulfurovum sp.]